MLPKWRGTEAHWTADWFVPDAHTSSTVAVSRPLPAVLSPLTISKRFGWTMHPTSVWSCQAKRLSFSKWQPLTERTGDKGLRAQIQKP